MSRIKANNITPFSGANVTIGGNAVPSGNSKTLGTESNPWGSVYVVDEQSINFVSSSTSGGLAVVASIKAFGENGVPGGFKGQIFTETNNNYRGSFSVGRNNAALGTASLVSGLSNTASANYSHAEGFRTLSSGVYAHAEGSGSTASGAASHAEGNGTLASAPFAHAEGAATTASATGAHAEGAQTQATAFYAHAEGSLTIAAGGASHAEGQGTQAIGGHSHAEGSGTVALGDGSHAGGLFTIASGSYQTVVGEYNALGDTTSHFIVGGGVSGSRKDAFKVTHSSSIVVATQTTVPSWVGTEGEMVPFVSGSVYRLYAYLGGVWRSSSFA
jgi:hypothetical protein